MYLGLRKLCWNNVENNRCRKELRLIGATTCIVVSCQDKPHQKSPYCTIVHNAQGKVEVESNYSMAEFYDVNIVYIFMT